MKNTTIFFLGTTALLFAYSCGNDKTTANTKPLDTVTVKDSSYADWHVLRSIIYASKSDSLKLECHSKDTTRRNDTSFYKSNSFLRIIPTTKDTALWSNTIEISSLAKKTRLMLLERKTLVAWDSCGDNQLKLFAKSDTQIEEKEDGSSLEYSRYQSNVTHLKQSKQINFLERVSLDTTAKTADKKMQQKSHILMFATPTVSCKQNNWQEQIIFGLGEKSQQEWGIKEYRYTVLVDTVVVLDEHWQFGVNAYQNEQEIFNVIHSLRQQIQNTPDTITEFWFDKNKQLLPTTNNKRPVNAWAHLMMVQSHKK